MEDQKQLRSKRKPRKCPKCGSKNVKSIFYGMPANEEEVMKRYVIGGCIVSEDDAPWICTDCNTEVFHDPPWSGGGAHR